MDNHPKHPHEHEAGNQRSKSFFQQLSPKAAFFFGVVVTTAVLSLVGLLITLPLALKAGKGSTKSSSSSSTSTGSTSTNTAATPTAPTPQDIKFRPVSDSDYVRGAKDAKVTLIEYSDFECPFCKRVHPTLQQALKEYEGKVRWVYRQFPIEQLHSQAPKESEASLCAGEQGKFWEFTDLIFDVTPSNDGLDLTKLPEYAEQVGADPKKFQTCLDSGKYTDAVQADIEDAGLSGARGTPYTLVVASNGKSIPISGAYPIDTFRQAIDLALKQ